MLCAKRKLDGQNVSAYFESKRNGPFLCCECNEEVMLRAGKQRVNYFAHANPLACRNGEGESEEHRRCKMEIFSALEAHSDVFRPQLECRFERNRADVFACIRGVPVAIEVQISALSLETIMRRTIDYFREGIYVLWLLQWTPKLDVGRYAPTDWEKWIHATYFGHVYYWTEGLNVVSYHFAPYVQIVPKKTWYSPKGEKMTGGGYTKSSLRYRTPVRGRTLDLTKDFGPQQRDWWEGNGLKVPDAKLFMHCSSEWKQKRE